MRVRASESRGRTTMSWLESRHTFSFGRYVDRDHVGFRNLRVINEDWIAGGGGFPTHPHKDMEIVTYVIDGALEHADSTGATALLSSGEVQRMTAGRGIAHSEVNASSEETLHLLQIWLFPEREGLTPGHEEHALTRPEREGRLFPLAAPADQGAALAIHQDVTIYASLLAAGDHLEHAIAPGRHAWIQMVSGTLEMNGVALDRGDGAAISDEPTLSLLAEVPSEFLLFDLA